jgi:aspartyl/glutamyl-tRNA (fragment)
MSGMQTSGSIGQSGTSLQDKKNDTDPKSKISSINYSNNRNLSYSMSKSLATIGKGELIVGDKDISYLSKDELASLQSDPNNKALYNSDDLRRLNRDSSKLNKELYSTKLSSNVDASVDMRLFSEGGRKEIKRELDQVLDDLDDIRLSIKDKFETNKLTEEQKRIVETQSAKDALTILLRQSGVKEETINEIVNSPTIKNFAYIADKLNSKAVSSGDLSTDQNPEISYTKNGTPSMNLGTVIVDGSESMLNVYGLATKGADAAAFIIDKIGRTAATVSVAAIQTMISGPTKTIAGIATDNISDRFTRPIKQAISDKTRKYLTEDEDEAYIAENQRGINIVSDSVGEVAVGAVFGGINRFIKSLTKLSKANKDLINNNKLESVEKKLTDGNSNNKNLSLDSNTKVEDKIKSTTKIDKTETNSKNISKDDKELKDAEKKLTDGDSNVDNPLENIVYSDRVKDQIEKNKKGEFHTFPEEVLAFGKYGKVTKIIGRDGIERTKVEIEGSYGKKDGVFEFIIENDGKTVNHRFFKPKPKTKTN